MQELKNSNQFSRREEYINYLKDFFQNQIKIDDSTSYIQGGIEKAKRKLENIEPIKYCKTRNYLNGNITRLSPYIRNGLLTTREVLEKALEIEPNYSKIEKFIQELVWRDFWHDFYDTNPELIWKNIENYKTGFCDDEYSEDLPEDIKKGKTNIALIDAFLAELIKTGYIHNRGRMYLASYICHFRKIKWQAGAKFFLSHLLDGDLASNNLSFQWVASTFSNKPYIFNLENAQKYCQGYCDLSAENNKEINFSYDELNQKLFRK